MTKNDIIALADRIAAGIATDDEIAAWNALCNGMTAMHALLPEEQQALEAQLRERIAQRTAAAPVRRMGRMKWAAAAAVLIAVAGAGYLFLLRPQPAPAPIATATSKPAAPADDIRPGTQKAILTLADGSTVALDRQASGTLATQGNTKVVSSNGQLQYAPAGDAAPEKTVAMNTVTTPRGGQYQLVLSDGTKVWLNAASYLRFPAGFSGGTREVEIKGEAYFEVAKDAAHPFLVHVAGSSTVQVLGTSFNINAYEDESTVATTLLDGSIGVGRNGMDKVLKPGDQAQMDNKGIVHVLHNVNTQQVVAWKDGFFQFDNAGIKTVMRQLSRWYDVEVEYRGNIDPSMQFEGKLGRDLKLQQVLKILQKSEVHFAIEGRNIIVVP